MSTISDSNSAVPTLTDLTSSSLADASTSDTGSATPTSDPVTTSDQVTSSAAQSSDVTSSPGVISQPQSSAEPTSSSGGEQPSQDPGSSASASASSTPSPSSGQSTTSPGSSAQPTSSGGQSASQSASASVSANPSGSGSVTSGAGGASSTVSGSTSVSDGSSVVYVTVTNSDGVVTTSPTATISGGSSGSSSSSSSNHTGAIVGGVVGGVAGLALIAILLWFLLKRRKSHRDDFDDMMFDPGRPENQAPIDLGHDGGAPTVEPYYPPGVASTTASPEMSQYPRSAATASDGGYGAPSSGGLSNGTSAGFAGRGAGGHGMYDLNMEPLAMPTAHPTGVDGAAATGAAGFAGADVGAMGAKQREAYQEQQRFRVQNQHLAGSSGAHAQPMSPTDTDATGVTVHRDAGAIEDEEPSYNNEIPPTYESIGRKR
ncbi:hypothetical protein AYX13_02830 [Cryptococcus neoformans]|nr:hypothetical protein AYX13_02830 [Cryptococcus neoformans var. grubii]